VIAVDTSSLVAVVLGEDDAERHLDQMQQHPCALSTVSLVEAAIVVEARQGMDAARDLDLLVEGAIDTVVPVDVAHARAAVAAWRRFGRGRHPASLNFGDCFSYALAHIAGVPLLYKGKDFGQTDVVAAL
jgi:ribonuclease VapC